MKRYKISCLIAAAGLSMACVRQVRTVSGLPPMPAAEPSTKRATAFERQVQNARDAGEGDYVVRSLRQKMAAEPGNLAVRLELIDHYTQGGYPELAIEHCRLAATRFPESAAVQLPMAKLLRQMKMTREAVQALGAFLAAHPQESPDYESWLGIMRDELGDWAEGEKAHRAALALNANLDSLHNNLGYNLLMQGRPKEAAQEFREALKLRPNSEVARNNLGMAMAATPQDAVLHWQSVSDPATAHSNMAALLIKQKRYAEARRELDLALGYNKNHAAALNNLRLVSELDGKPAVIPLKPAQTKWGKFRSKMAKIVGG
jgi:tetratricopeptide (TPR) repeat protein